MKDALALALVHFIWQGAVLAAVGALLMRVTRVPSVRYAIGVATMVAMLLAPVMTCLAIQNAGAAVPQWGTTTEPSAVARATRDMPANPVGSARSSSGAIVPTTWILGVWAVGVMMLSLRFVGGWAVARRLATQTLTPVGEELQELAGALAARLNVRGAVRVCESASVAVPIMIGWLRPVIVLPPAALAALPLAQLEALLAHELAHIRRHDYLVNLLQVGVETLCFYHPAVWWISREVRNHREHCCDDVAVGVCDRLTYVTALSSLASMASMAGPQFALSATGGSLRDRVRRLIEPTTHSASPKGAWIAMLPILLVVSFVTPNAWGTQTTTPATAASEAIAAAPAAMATTAQEVIAVEQARPATVAREAARAQARERAEQAKVRDVVEAAQSREATRARDVQREVARALETRRETVTEEIARRQIQLSLENQLREMERTVARQKELVDTGLSTRNDLVAAEQQLHQTRLHLERTMTTHELESRRQQLDREFQERHGLATTHRNLSTLEPTVQLQAQDRLEITIDGEPDLPTMFTVREDGSIRYPFLGSIRVQGSTAGQVESAIRKLMSDKGLGRNPSVTVSAWRIR